MNFKKNYHLARKFKISKVDFLIENYNPSYPVPKYLLFIKEMLKNGYTVKVYQSRVSKYVFLVKDNKITKIRFSNHKPLFGKEEEGDCDYYVGVSHKQVMTTEKLTEELLK